MTAIPLPWAAASRRHLPMQFHAGFRCSGPASWCPTSTASASATSTARRCSSRARAAHTATTSSTRRGSIRRSAASAALAGLRAELGEHGLGLVLDIVPNHVAASPDNPWWSSLLASGRRSPYAAFFDVDWERERAGRLLLPILGAPYGEELAAGNVRLDADAEAGFRLAVYERRLPLTPRSLRTWSPGGFRTPPRAGRGPPRRRRPGRAPRHPRASAR